MSGFFESGDELATQALLEAKADVRRALTKIEIQLSGLTKLNPSAAMELRRDAVTFLAGAQDLRGRNSDATHLSLVGAPAETNERIPEIEIAIMEILEGENAGMHLEDINARLEDLGHNASRGGLSVRLHRMVRAGRLTSPARGHYALSTLEQARRSQA